MSGVSGPEPTAAIWAPLRACGWPGCRSRQRDPYCTIHARYSSRNHRGIPRGARGLGADFERARRFVLERDGGRCGLRLAGCTVIATTADHIVPRAAGGTNDPSNLRAACRHCNAARGARPLPRPEPDR
jgi:5-methylcytosine-specific restriction protein A